MSASEAKAIQDTLLHSSILGPLSKRLGCHKDSSFNTDPLPRHSANHFKAYIAAVYIDRLKDRSKTSGAGADALERWLGAIFAHLGAKVNLRRVEEPGEIRDGSGTGSEVRIVKEEPVDDCPEKAKGRAGSSTEPDVKNEDVQILDGPSVHPSDTALANLQNLRKHRILDFHLHTLTEDNQWRTEVFGKHRGRRFSASILRAKKKTAEKVTAHLVLRYLGFLGKEAIGADSATWYDAHDADRLETKVESPVRPMGGTTGKKRKKGASQHGDKYKDKGKKKQNYHHDGVKHEQIQGGRVEVKLEPKLKLEKPDQWAKYQPWAPEQMGQRVMAVRR